MPERDDERARLAAQGHCQLAQKEEGTGKHAFQTPSALEAPTEPGLWWTTGLSLDNSPFCLALLQPPKHIDEQAILGAASVGKGMTQSERLPLQPQPQC